MSNISEDPRTFTGPLSDRNEFLDDPELQKKNGATGNSLDICDLRI